MKIMIEFYTNNLIEDVFQIINRNQLCDLLIFDLNNIEYTGNDEEYNQKIKDILSVSSYILKPGANIILINQNNINIVDINLMLKDELLWNKRRTIIYQSKLKHKDLLASEYTTIFWYSDNYRVTDPDPICNNFDDKGNELSDLWNNNVNILEMIIKMFSNENNIIFEPYVINNELSKYCEKMNRNYIGVQI